jgi:hypothetical protein
VLHLVTEQAETKQRAFFDLSKDLPWTCSTFDERNLGEPLEALVSRYESRMSVGALFRSLAVLKQASELVPTEGFEGRVPEAESELAKGVCGRIDVAQRAIGVAEVREIVWIVRSMTDRDLAAG